MSKGTLCLQIISDGSGENVHVYRGESDDRNLIKCFYHLWNLVER